MALNNFTPTVWAGMLLANLNKSLVYGQPGIINKDYEGEISRFGDTVKINAIGRVTVGDYTKDSDMGSPETLTSAQATLLIDQSKYFNFQIDDIDAAQNNPKVMSAAMAESAYALANVADQYIASLYTSAGTQIGDDTTPKTVGIGSGDSNAYNLLVDIGTALAEKNVPVERRWVITPPWFHALLLKDERFTRGGAPDWMRQVFTTGLIGQVSGLAILQSNNVPVVSSTKYKIIAGHPIAWTYAEQIGSVEAYRPEKRFADALKGLHLYGAKVVRPDALVVMTATKGTL